MPPSTSAGVTSSTPQNSAVAPPRPRPQPSRRKIEYIPLAREVDSHGGRDLRLIEEELSRITQCRPLRDINEWGTVDIEALTMSIRSRLSTELSYALTTFTLLSTMRGQTPGSGFPIVQCPDLLDEILDLVEDEAFGEEEDLEPPIDEAEPMPTHREMVNVAYDEGSQIFAGLERPQGSKDPDIGPRQRPANIILTIFNIIRNLSVIPDNVPYLAKHERLLDILLRVCCVRRNDNVPRAMSMALSLT
jgi:SWI/SNF chromatin-remodeling complex subunit SWI1